MKSGLGEVDEDILEFDVSMYDALSVQISHSADKFGEHALHEMRSQEVSFLTGKVEEVAALTVRENEQSAGRLIFAGFEVDERRVRYAFEHFDFALEADFNALLIGTSSRSVLDDFDGD